MRWSDSRQTAADQLHLRPRPLRGRPDDDHCHLSPESAEVKGDYVLATSHLTLSR